VKNTYHAKHTSDKHIIVGYLIQIEISHEENSNLLDANRVRTHNALVSTKW
jgi:hypothetical protein